VQLSLRSQTAHQACTHTGWVLVVHTLFPMRSRYLLPSGENSTPSDSLPSFPAYVQCPCTQARVLSEQLVI
jgi:hypothetical protein